jgi:hypothetical protein
MLARCEVRKRRSKPRRGPLRDAAYRKYVKSEPCAVCYRLPSDPAHTENNGMSSKGPDSSCAPLCRLHHREYDAGRVAFEAKYNVDMKAVARRHWERYQRERVAA